MGFWNESRNQGIAMGASGLLGLSLLALLIYHFTSTQPPIKVRGGAMTVRAYLSSGTAQWSPYTSADGRTGSCVPLDMSIKKVHVYPDVPPGTIFYPHTDGDLTGNWKVFLFGRDANFNEDDTQGLEIDPVTNCNTNQSGIALLPIGNFSQVNTGLPPTDLTARRYKNTDTDTHPGHCGVDEDACEHMSAVRISSSNTNLATCDNGDCLVTLGK